MPATWKQLVFVPSAEAQVALREGWGWLVDETFQPFMNTAAGDVFFESPDGAIHWLDTGVGQLARVANNRDEFLEQLRSDHGNEWLLTPIVDQLVDSGMLLREGDCYGFKVLPVMGGTYTADNLAPLPAASWFGFSGHIHSQIKDLPEGTSVQLKFDET